MFNVPVIFLACTLKDIHPCFVHYHIHPDENVSWGELFSAMEVAKLRFNLEAYSVGQTSLEQVFLNFTKSQINTSWSWNVSYLHMLTFYSKICFYNVIMLLLKEGQLQVLIFLDVCLLFIWLLLTAKLSIATNKIN